MSLLFPDRLTVWLTREGVSVMRRTRAGHGRHERVLQLPGGDQDPCALVETALAQYRKKHAGAAQFELVLSSAFVQMLCLPMQPALGTVEEEALFVQYRFEEVFGKQARDWRFSWDAGLAFQPVLACAMPLALLQGLEAAFQRQGAALLAVGPWLKHFFNAVLRPLRQASLHCMVVEGGQVFALQTEQGQWSRLHQVSLPSHETDDGLRACVRRELLLFPMQGDEALSIYGAAAFQPEHPSARWVRCKPEEVWAQGGLPLVQGSRKP